MSEHMFGVFRPAKELSDRTFSRINKIAKAHSAQLTGGRIPGTGLQYWFTCRNQGDPFDRAVRDAVFADLDAAGIDVKAL